MLTYKPESRLTSSDVVKEFRDIWVRLLRKYKERMRKAFNNC
jgi:hypothetical protein